jgi:Holliday junction resolvase RusA-like endonuclease
MRLPRSPQLLRALKASGILLDEPSPPLPPGTAICEFEVPTRPVPWKAPSTTQTGHSYKDPKLVEWQSEVASCAGKAMTMNGRKPYGHAVEVWAEFHLAPSRNGSYGDTTNLLKAVEDALQGVVLVNDKRVVRSHPERFLVGVTRDHAWVRVIAVENQ